ncbi:hypothetical protein GCM10027081_42640 [Cupriavidus yeoncheonensis]
MGAGPPPRRRGRRAGAGQDASRRSALIPERTGKRRELLAHLSLNVPERLLRFRRSQYLYCQRRQGNEGSLTIRFRMLDLKAEFNLKVLVAGR